MTKIAAVAQSVARNEIVTVDHDVTLMDQLSAESDDCVVGKKVTEYWGTTESGHEWRVHVRHATDSE